MARDGSNSVQEIAAFLGVDDVFINPPILKESKVNYWKDSASKADISKINSILSEEISQMGYDL